MKPVFSLFATLFFAVLGSTYVQASEGTQAIWIDSDPSCGLGATYDVDDCWAILRTSKSDLLKVVGISSVYGNASIEKTHATSEKLINKINSRAGLEKLPTPIMGAAAETQFSPTEVTFELAKALRREKLIIVALGPLTNIAAFVRNYPDLVKNIDKVIAVAGQHPEQSFYTGDSAFFHLHDLNFQKDSLAFKIVLESGIPIVLTPFELAQKNRITENHLLEFIAGDEVESWLAQKSRPWLKFWKQVLKEDGFYPFDSMAIGYLTDRQRISCTERFAKVVERRSLFVKSRDTLEVFDMKNEARSIVYCGEIKERVPIL